MSLNFKMKIIRKKSKNKEQKAMETFEKQNS